MVTAAEHADLRTRLVALIVEYAAASQRSEATAKVDAVLASLPQGEHAEADADALQARLTDLAADNDLLAHNLAAAAATVTSLEAELAQLRAPAEEPTDTQQ